MELMKIGNLKYNLYLKVCNSYGYFYVGVNHLYLVTRP